ncbi:MAG: hypothetical protein K5930_03550 [Treponemataceae bacterium]|nr:hypothetical protein [Treponemataceae bacterium]
MDFPEVIYYTDELNDEFSTAQITPRKIDASYKYRGKGFSWTLAHIFWYRIVAIPIAYFFMKIKFHHKIVNKRVLSNMHHEPFFIYGNHTNAGADALIPTFVVSPKSAYVIVHANNVSMPVLGPINPFLGAIPLPDDMAATRNFLEVIKLHMQKKHCIMIYPEAHIWPYCTWIRNFSDTSFRYPVQYKTPVFCFTNTYQKRRFSKKPRMVTYVDGPFFADPSLSQKEQRGYLRNCVYNAMVERSKNSNCEIVRYIKKDSDNK